MIDPTLPTDKKKCSWTRNLKAITRKVNYQSNYEITNSNIKPRRHVQCLKTHDTHDLVI